MNRIADIRTQLASAGAHNPARLRQGILAGRRAIRIEPGKALPSDLYCDRGAGAREQTYPRPAVFEEAGRFDPASFSNRPVNVDVARRIGLEVPARALANANFDLQNVEGSVL